MKNKLQELSIYCISSVSTSVVSTIFLLWICSAFNEKRLLYTSTKIFEHSNVYGLKWFNESLEILSIQEFFLLIVKIYSWNTTSMFGTNSMWYNSM